MSALGATIQSERAIYHEWTEEGILQSDSCEAADYDDGPVEEL